LSSRFQVHFSWWVQDDVISALRTYSKAQAQAQATGRTPSAALHKTAKVSLRG
jgi:hypothetical protein